jgi:hypothetical protein
VVTAVAEPVAEESDDVELAPVEAAARDVLELDARAFVVWVLASAGSWPAASCTRIPPVLAMNIAVAAPTTRRLMRRTRRRRIRRDVEVMTSASAPSVASP